jgi:hypothetical protein
MVAQKIDQMQTDPCPWYLLLDKTAFSHIESSDRDPMVARGTPTRPIGGNEFHATYTLMRVKDDRAAAPRSQLQILGLEHLWPKLGNIVRSSVQVLCPDSR